MSTERERPLHELLSRDMVDIYVGPENTHWILHEKLLCHRSRFFRDIFYQKKNKSSKNSQFGLPDEEDGPFKLFVGWLYSERAPPPKEEADLGPLFDLYLMAEKWEIRKLILEILDSVRMWYHDTDSWPSLRRVQYIYANTENDSPMRQLLVSCVSRMLVLNQGMPTHWENALRKNGQLAVDVILCVQKWHFEPQNVPDAREESVVPMVEEAEQKAEVKQEDDDDEDNKLDWGYMVSNANGHATNGGTATKELANGGGNVTNGGAGAATNGQHSSSEEDSYTSYDADSGTPKIKEEGEDA